MDLKEYSKVAVTTHVKKIVIEQRAEGINAILFYDKSNNIVAGGRGNGKPTGFKRIDLTKNQWIVGLKVRYNDYIQSIGFKIAEKL